MPLPLRLDGLLAKIESTYGTDSVPVAATDAVRVSERVWSSFTPDYAWDNLRDEMAWGAILPGKPALPRGRFARIVVAWEAKGAGATYVGLANSPEALALLRACGMTQANPSDTITYVQASQSHDSCTIYAYAGGMLFKVVGCRGRMRWPITAGQLGIIRFEMIGILTADPADTALPAITYDSPEPIASVNMGLTVGAWTPDVISGEFDQGVDPQRLDSANGADGIKEYDYGEATPLMTLTAKAVALATYNPHADLKARTARAINLTWGAAQYDRVLLAITNAYINSIKHTNQNGFAGWELEYKPTDWTISFT